MLRLSSASRYVTSLPVGTRGLDIQEALEGSSLPFPPVNLPKNLCRESQKCMEATHPCVP